MLLPLTVFFQVVLALFNATYATADNQKSDIDTIFEAFGYSPVCVTYALTSCERTSENVYSINVVDLQREIRSLSEEVKSIRESEWKNSAISASAENNIGNLTGLFESLSEEVKTQLENVSNSLPEIKTLLQEAKSEREIIAASLSDLKLILQDVKMEKEIVRKNSDKLLNDTTLLMELAITVGNATQNSETLTAIRATLEKLTQEKLYKNCAELRAMGDCISGLRTVYPYPNCFSHRSVDVYCDQETDGGGWTVFQNRDDLPVRVSFQRSWQEYVDGFGNLNDEFWLGLDNLHALTSSTSMELRVDLEDWEGEKRWVKYNSFHVGDAASKYVLSVAGYSGNAGNEQEGLTDNNLGKFSTPDQDNDSSSGNCAKDEGGGWWYTDCSLVNMNGFQYKGDTTASKAEGLNWYSFRGHFYSLKKVSMKMRPVFRGF